MFVFLLFDATPELADKVDGDANEENGDHDAKRDESQKQKQGNDDKDKDGDGDADGEGLSKTTTKLDQRWMIGELQSRTLSVDVVIDGEFLCTDPTKLITTAGTSHVVASGILFDDDSTLITFLGFVFLSPLFVSCIVLTLSKLGESLLILLATQTFVPLIH